MRGHRPSVTARSFYSTFFQLTRHASAEYCSTSKANQCYRGIQGAATASFRRPLRGYGALTFGRLGDKPSTRMKPPVRPFSTTSRRSDVTKGECSEYQTLSAPIRKLMRRIPHPVIVITASDPSLSPSQPGVPEATESTFRAMTVSSFNTVTLDPTPIVSFNVRTPSSSFDALSARGTFLVHFLASSADGARVASAFTKGKAVEEFAKLVKDRKITVFSGKGTDEAPMMVGKGVTKVLRCRILKDKTVTIGDHVVVVGEALGLIGSQEVLGEEGFESLELGLMYVDQQYRSVGEKIVAEPEDHQPSPEEEISREEAPFQKTLGLNVRRGDEIRHPT